MTSITSSFNFTNPVAQPAKEPLLAVASTSTNNAETAEETVPVLTNAYSSASGGRMRMLLDGMARGASATCRGAIDVGRAGYKNIVKPAGSAAINASAMTVKTLATFIQESVTGVEFVEGHTVSGREDSKLGFWQQMLPTPTGLFTPNGRGVSEKGREFLKNVATYAGGVSASFIYQMAIVGVADTLGRISAQATSDELEKGNFALPLAVTGALTLVTAAQTAHLLKSMNYLSNLGRDQKAVVIAAHHGIKPSVFDAKPDAEKEALEAKTKRDWVMLATGSALMPTSAFAMCLMAKLFPAQAFASPLFMGIAQNLVKVAVRSPVYGGMRETLQEIFSGPKGGMADMTHTEAGRSAIKYGVVSGAVNIGQQAAQKFTHNIFNKPKLTTSSTTGWSEKAAVLAALSVVNAIGECFNWVDLTVDRTNKCAELAKQKLIEEHKAHGMPPPIPEKLKAVAEQAKFAFNLGLKDQSFVQAIRNIKYRVGGSLFAREGVYAFANAISNFVSQLEHKIEEGAGDKNSHDVLNNLVLGICTCFTYIKFNACGQSMGALRAIRAHNDREDVASTSASSNDSDFFIDWDSILSEEGSTKSRLEKSASFGDIEAGVPLLTEDEIPRKIFRSGIISPERSHIRRLDSRVMSDFN